MAYLSKTDTGPLRFLSISAQGAFAVCVFALPFPALEPLLPFDFSGVHPFFLLAGGFVLTSLAWTALARTAEATRAEWILTAASVLTLCALGAAACCKLPETASWWASRLSHGELLAVGVATAVYFVSLLLFASFPYPGTLLELGDQFYYYMDANRVRKASDPSWSGECMILCFSKCALAYERGYPVLSATLRTMFSTFGENYFSLNVYCALSGVLTALCMAVPICGLQDANGGALLLCVAFAALLPIMFNHICTGCHTLPGALGFICVCAPLFFPCASGAVVGAAGLFYMFFARPESRLLAAIVAGLAAAFVFFAKASPLMTGVAALLALALAFPAFVVVRRFAAKVTDLAINHLTHSPKKKAFICYYRSGYDGFFHASTMKNLNLRSKNAPPLVNSKIIDEIIAHPFRFARWLSFKFATSVVYVWACAFFNPNHDGFWHKMTFPLIAAGCLLTFHGVQTPQGLFICLATALYCLAFPVFNNFISDRHALLVIPAFLAATLQGFGGLLDSSPATLSVIAALAALDLTRAIRNRFPAKPAKFERLFKEIVKAKAALKPGAMIACSTPQMLNSFTGLRCAGAHNICHYAEDVAKSLKPDLILMDDLLRVDTPNYSNFMKSGKIPSGYDIAVHDEESSFLILARKNSTDSGASK